MVKTCGVVGIDTLASTFHKTQGLAFLLGIAPLPRILTTPSPSSPPSQPRWKRVALNADWVHFLSQRLSWSSPEVAQQPGTQCSREDSYWESPSSSCWYSRISTTHWKLLTDPYSLRVWQIPEIWNALPFIYMQGNWDPGTFPKSHNNLETRPRAPTRVPDRCAG